MIKITSKATEKLKELLIGQRKGELDKKEKQRKNWLGVRVGVKSGGCSGLEYIMDIEDTTTEHDKILDFGNGLRIIIDPKSNLYIGEMTLDYSDMLIGGGFQFVNPAATRTCSCGSSFSV